VVTYFKSHESVLTTYGIKTFLDSIFESKAIRRAF
jgi:hypothetical protein